MYKNLRAEMARGDVTTVNIASAIRKTERSARDKINGKSDFTLTEICAIRDTFFPGMRLEYLFARDDARTA